MTLGGRPPVKGGHRRINLSIEKNVHRFLKTIDNPSELVEKLVEPLAEMQDCMIPIHPDGDLIRKAFAMRRGFLKTSKHSNLVFFNGVFVTSCP